MNQTTDVRACPHCRRVINAYATRCMYCFEKSEPVKTKPTPPVGPAAEEQFLAEVPVDEHGASQTAVSRPSAAPRAADISYGERIVQRYRDAYQIAHAIVAQGNGIKAFAIVAACVVAVPFMFLALNVDGVIAFGVFLMGMLIATAIGLAVRGYGVRIAAEGQHLLASLDIAVNTSPFIDNKQRATAMSL